MVSIPFVSCLSIPILRFSPNQKVDQDRLESHIWVLMDVDPDEKLSDIREKEDQFLPFGEVKDQLDPAKTHWAILRLHNDSPSPVEYLLRESNESQMQVYVVEGNRLVYAGQSGQLVKISEEKIPEGISWEARIHLHLQPGQYQQIYLRSYHALQITQPFDLTIEEFAHYQRSIQLRNFYQVLFQGALGTLVLFHLLLFAVNKQKAYAYFSLYVILQLLFYQFFHGLSKEWFWGEFPRIDTLYAALPLLMPSSIILTNKYLLKAPVRGSIPKKSLDYFNILSLVLFVAALLMIYHPSFSKYGFRLTTIFILFNPLFIFSFLFNPFRKADLDTKFFLLGTLILSIISCVSSLLFYVNELLAGLTVQLAILLQVILFAIGLGYRQVKLAQEKDIAQKSLLHQLKLKRAFEKDLKLHFEKKVKERTSALEDQKNALLIAKKQADKANQFKSDLLAMIQHDIRTPIHAILGMSTLLQDVPAAQERNQMLNTLHIASANLLGLVNNILDYSKIEAGEIKLENESIVLHEVVEVLIDSILPLCKQKDLGLLLKYDSSIPYELFGSQTRLVQVLSNLLHNAAKFTSEGKITFEIKLKEQSPHQALLEFSVSDTGAGIPLQDQKNIFRGIKQKQSLPKMPHQGRGFGLAIVAKLLELQGSQIQLQSEEGKGSSFYFDLWLGLSSREKREYATSLENKKVLLVEDNIINQEVALRFLQQWGMEVELASNGVEALQKLDKQRFDLILLDLQMPIMDGYETATIIGQHDNIGIRDIPIIALSANTDQASRTKAKQAGIKRFIGKPFNPKDLKQNIEATLIK